MKDFYEGEILLLDKPQKWTSFDIVNKVRIAINHKFGQKLKVGHAGTLDPLATGLLILCTGRMTKKINDFAGLDKEYVAKINFGATTPSYDKETQFDKHFETNHITLELVENVLKSFIGQQLQMPPAYSAKRVDGTKAYIKARKGKTMEIKPSEIEIKEIEILEHNLPQTVSVRMSVSKGTYIRSFAYDLGNKLNSGAYLDQLRRTKIGEYSIQNAQTIDAFIEFINNL